MKIRTGFVSNSSSSLFCIIGYHVDEDLYDKLEEEYGNDLGCYDGYDEGFVVGLWAEKYLEKDKLSDACENVDNDIKEIVGEELFCRIRDGRDKAQLLYDTYEC